MTTTALSALQEPVTARTSVAWVLRIGAVLCFVGHGAFGFLQKPAWLAYLRPFGFSDATALELMPLIGLMDVVAAVAVLLSTSRIALGYMVVWAAWTALLRPLVGESPFEALERAGNYGVPLALLLVVWKSDPRWIRSTLQWTTALLLLGHGMLGVEGKALLTGHYAVIGLPQSTTMAVGLFEVILALVVLLRPSIALLLFISGWKIATESLFLAEGAPVWEFIERAGSYTAPAALAMLGRTRRSDRALE